MESEKHLESKEEDGNESHEQEPKEQDSIEDSQEGQESAEDTSGWTQVR